MPDLFIANATCNISGTLGTLNYSDPANAKQIEHTTAEIVVNAYILPCFLIIGVALNLAFLVVVIRIRWMRNITNVYLTNLCIADIMFLMVGVGDKFTRHLASPVAGDRYIYKLPECIIVYFVINTSHFAIMFFITLITFERFYTVCKPLHRRFITSLKSTICAGVTAWVCTFIFALAMVSSTRSYTVFCTIWPDDDKYQHYPEAVGHCLPYNRWMGITGNIVQTIPFFIVLIINAILYVRIFKHLDRMVDHRRDSNAPTGRVKQIRGQISRMLIANGIVFFTCVTPWTLYSLIFEVKMAMELPSTIPEESETIFMVFRVLLYFNSVANPLLFNFASQRYRHAFLDAFTCCKRIRNCCKMSRRLMRGNAMMARSADFSVITSSVRTVHSGSRGGSR